MSFIESLIPKHLIQDPKVRQSLSSIVLTDVSIFVFSLIFAPIFNSIGFIEGAYIMLYTMFASLGYLLFLRITDNLNAYGYYFTVQSIIVCMSLMYFTGGIVSPFVFILFCICPLTFIFFKNRIAIIWSSITILGFLGFAMLQIIGFEFQQKLSNQAFYIAWTINFCFATVNFLLAISNYRSGLRKVGRQIKKSNEQLKKSNEELERFAYIASHDLKSPIRSIISFISLLKKRNQNQLDQSGQEFLQIIATNADQMHHLIEDILEYSKSSNRQVKKEKVNLSNLLKIINDQIHTEESYKDSQIVFSQELPTIYSDLTMIKQVFQNLIENGLKYNNSSNKIVSIQYMEQKDCVYFMVKDNGIGMEEIYFNRIFEMFQRLHNKNEYQGTGIGLAVCKKMVDQLDGKIWVTSKIDEGTIFHVTFDKTVLVVEDVPESEDVEELASTI